MWKMWFSLNNHEMKPKKTVQKEKNQIKYEM